MSNSNKKPTIIDNFNDILNVLEENGLLTDERKAFLEKRIEVTAKKNASGSSKPTAVQVANEGIKSAILEGMEPNRLYTITELIKEIPECADMTNQRVSALVRQLKDDGKVERVEEKRKAYFRLAQ